MQDQVDTLGLIRLPAQVRVSGRPHAAFMKDAAVGALSIDICGECGYAELHVSNARRLYAKYEEANGS